jgi:hypothetical protein
MGRVTGRSVREIRFRALYGEDFQLGEILVAEDEERGRALLVRVVDIEYGADAEGDNWSEQVAGSMMQAGLAGGYQLREKERRLYPLGVCIPLGFVSEAGFRKPKSLVPHFSAVRRAEMADYAFLSEGMGDVEVGFLRSGDRRLDIRIGVRGESFPSHVGVFATTGMGKSNLMKSLAASVMRGRRYGLLVLDPHGEYFAGQPGYKGLSHLADASERLVIFSGRRLAGAHNAITISSSEIRVEDLLNLQEYADPQKELMLALVGRHGERWLNHVSDATAESLFDEFEEHFHEGTIHVVKRRVDRLMSSGRVSRDASISMTRAVVQALHEAKVVLVDTSSMPEMEELLVSTILARAVFDRHQRTYENPDEFAALPPVMITMEEAQRVLDKSKGTVFSRIAREGRKFKVGLCAISQQPKLIDNQVISQFNTLFILGLADKRDREILRDASKQDIAELENEIQSLMVGEALVTSPFVPFALPVSVHKYEDYLAELNAEAAPKKPRAKPDKRFY